MKTIILVAAMVFLTNGMFAQDQGAVVIFGGYGQSFFSSEIGDENSKTEEAKYVPVGVQVLFGIDNFSVGGEVNYAAVPFTFTMSSDGTDLADLTITQLYYGGVIKFRLGTHAGLNPYIRAGAGMYTGKFKVNWTDDVTRLLGYEDSETDYKSAFGYNLGAGFELAVSPTSGIIVEFVYHKVDRTLDIEGAEAGKADNAAIHAGFKLGF
jgi:opacity protein-like surface antigen